MEVKCKKKILYPIQHSVCYSNITSSYKDFHICTDEIIEPNFFDEAATDSRWIDAMKNEIDALERNNTWQIVDLPRSKRAIGCRWIYKKEV